MKTIETIVLDMGRVLLDFSEDKALSPWFPRKEDLELARRIIFESGDWFAVDAGALTEEEALKKWCTELPGRLRDDLKTMFENWHTTLVPIDGMAALIRDLKKAGYPCYLLSNTSMRFYTYYREVEALRLLDGYLISAEHHLAKPDPAIYRKLAELFGLNLASCYFVDDNADNIQAARSVGMEAFCFAYDVDALRADMRRKGIAV